MASITLVTDEILGYTRTGGIGTATSFLALALGRRGHSVELLYTGDRPSAPMTDEWRETYERGGVRVRVLERTERRVEPAFFARMLDVEHALAGERPDVVVVQDLAAPAYTALRMRQLGLAFDDTLFVVYCHGSRRWITDTARKVRVLPGAHAITMLEQASVEIADAVVAPSRYLLDWMRGERWKVPSRSFVIPHVSRSVALAEAPPARVGTNGRVERIAFFGRLEERKGIAPFIGALNSLPPQLLDDVGIEFLGRATPAWNPQRIRAELADHVRNVSFATDLDQPEALARLSRPGTLAVMPSYGETFSNAVYECLERGIPFLASDAGAPVELVHEDDRERVLFEPTAEGLAQALREALTNGRAMRAAKSAFDPRKAVETWEEVLRLKPEPRIRADSAEDEFVPFGEGLDEDAIATLQRAQAVSGADVVTCGVRIADRKWMFLGDPGGLGLLANHYGVAGLIRRELLDERPCLEWQPVYDESWPLFAHMHVNGAKIVSIPRALVAHPREPGNVDNAPSDALLVVHEFERTLPQRLRSLARLAAGLAVSSRREQPRRRRSLLRRLPLR